MMNLKCRVKDYIKPFERTLALKELSIIASNEPMQPGVDLENSSEFLVSTDQPINVLADRLAYWETISSDNQTETTVQSLREATVNIVRNGIDLQTLRDRLPFPNGVSLPNRRCLRYGTHGIHEYRGKFFPQLVRSLINISGTGPDGIVADPMSGSGTTIVEAMLFGCRGIGLDMNPLSVFLGNTKCELLTANPIKLEKAYEQVRQAVLAPESRGKKKHTYLLSLPIEDQEYLKKWFDSEVLGGLDEIANIVKSVEYPPAKNLMWVSLSNILRSVSWQKKEDLRVRREIRFDVEIDPKKEFLEEISRSIRVVLAHLYQEQPTAHIPHIIAAGDARQCQQEWAQYKGVVDVVITSPPYATALPYLDTDRLSLCYLGLLPRPEHRNKDQLMIGNREVSEKTRRSYMSHFENNKRILPKNACELIQKIGRLNEGTNAGFRRKNLPALLSKYFFDMHEVFNGIYDVLKPGGQAFVVVGNNHTIAGGKRVDIPTAELLEETAQELGFANQPALSMDMLVSRDIFKKNAVNTEKILHLKKPN